jgi:hypothetical protein
MNDDYFSENSEFDDNITEKPPKKNGSWLKSCLGGCLIFIIIGIIAGYFAYIKVKEVAYNKTAEYLITGTRAILQKMELPEAEIENVIIPLNELADRIKNQEITIEEIKKIGILLVDGPLAVTLFSRNFEIKFITNNNELSKKQKAIAHKIITRYTHGVIKYLITEKETDEVFELISHKRNENSKRKQKRKLKKHLTKKEILNCLKVMETSIDKHKIENKIFELNISNEVRKIIKEGLNR